MAAENNPTERNMGFLLMIIGGVWLTLAILGVIAELLNRR